MTENTSDAVSDAVHFFKIFLQTILLTINNYKTHAALTTEFRRYAIEEGFRAVGSER